jgi:hypothetical protein
VLLHNLIELSAFGATEAAGALSPRAFEALQHAHLFSAMVVMLFLAVSLALWAHNWYGNVGPDAPTHTHTCPQMHTRSTFACAQATR